MNANEDVTLYQIDKKVPLLLENLTNIVDTFTHLTLNVEHNYLDWTNNKEGVYVNEKRAGYHRNKVK